MASCTSGNSAKKALPARRDSSAGKTVSVRASSRKRRSRPSAETALEEAEMCDDGNRLTFDGCSALCRQETGYTCTGEPSLCLPVCGDGVRIPPEQCDDGNPLDGDGCSSVCEIEYAAAEESSLSLLSSISSAPPLPLCGNGILEEGEQCDDGNPFEGDGCSVECMIEQISSQSSLSLLSSSSSLSSTTMLLAAEPAGTDFPWWMIALPLLLVAAIGMLGWVMTKRSGQSTD